MRNVMSVCTVYMVCFRSSTRHARGRGLMSMLSESEADKQRKKIFEHQVSLSSINLWMTLSRHTRDMAGLLIVTVFAKPKKESNVMCVTRECPLYSAIMERKIFMHLRFS